MMAELGKADLSPVSEVALFEGSKRNGFLPARIARCHRAKGTDLGSWE